MTSNPITNAEAENLRQTSNKLMDSIRAKAENNTIDYHGTFLSASSQISTIERFLNVTPVEILKDGYKNLLEFKLCQLYYCQALCQSEFSNGDKGILKQALESLEKASSICPNCIQLQEDIEKMRDDISSLKSVIEKKINKCFIATATYGSSLAPEVKILRQFRDTRLRKSQIGKHFISSYERYSPPLADWIEVHSTVRLLVQRFVLSPIVWCLKQWL
ncbi:MAG: CFI-box-CTERM domain-containing protein [Chloroflexota bacterium]